MGSWIAKFVSEFDETSGTLLSAIGAFWHAFTAYTMQVLAGLLVTTNYGSSYWADCGTDQQRITIRATWRGGNLPNWYFCFAGTGSDSTSNYLNIGFAGASWTLKRGNTTIATVSDAWNVAGTTRTVVVAFLSGVATLDVYDGSGTLIGSQSASTTSMGTYARVYAYGTKTTPAQVDIEYLKVETWSEDQSPQASATFRARSRVLASGAKSAQASATCRGRAAFLASASKQTTASASFRARAGALASAVKTALASAVCRARARTLGTAAKSAQASATFRARSRALVLAAKSAFTTAVVRGRGFFAAGFEVLVPRVATAVFRARARVLVSSTAAKVGEALFRGRGRMSAMTRRGAAVPAVVVLPIIRCGLDSRTLLASEIPCPIILRGEL